MSEMIAAKIEVEQLNKLNYLSRVTGWNRSELIRRLIDAAYVKPPVPAVVQVELETEPA